MEFEVWNIIDGVDVHFGWVEVLEIQRSIIV